ncbi:MAG: hypothetical protein WKG06_07895 [Segetibacter sp.]
MKTRNSIPTIIKVNMTHAFTFVFLFMLLNLLAGCDKTNDLQTSALQSDALSAQRENLYAATTLSTNCIENPYKLTIGADSMLNAFRNLVRGVGVNKCNAYVVSGTSFMPAKYYISSNLPGIITFGVFYRTDRNAYDHLRVIWASTSGSYSYYGACAPNPIIFPSGLGENHVYSAKLIPVNQYKAINAPVTDINKVSGVRIADIAQITRVYIEGKSGYIATTEKASYDRPFSSKGIVAQVILKNGQQVLCYLINNYDGDTLLWKQKNI